MPAPNWMKNAAWILGATLTLSGMPTLAGPVPMQVEEPKVSAAQPPIQPEKDQAGWKSRKNASLTASQKAALKARQDTMKDMMALIQQKRRAIREARPEERQALAQELHNLILEQTQGADRIRDAARKDVQTSGDEEMDAKARTLEDALDQVSSGLKQKEETLRQLEALRQQVEEKLKQQEAKAGAEEKTAED